MIRFLEEFMGKENFQKIKLLKIWEILMRDSDEDHPLDTIEIIKKLADAGICCDRKTLYSDIDVLNEHGYVVHCKRSRRNMYFVDQSDFSVPELRILIDAVQSANFITENKTEELVEKIANLAGSYRADTLKNGVYFDVQKYKNECIYNNITQIDEAINNDRKISFKYFDYDENGVVVFRKDGARYLVNPIALVFCNECYYLVCYADKYKNLANYRIDRMADVEVEEERIQISECAVSFDIAEYKRKAFSMFTGDDVMVELEFHKSIIDSIMDRFGVEVKIDKVNGEWCKLSAEVKKSPVFFAWCAAFGDKLYIKEPVNIREEFIAFLTKSLYMYRQETKADAI